MLDSNPDDGYDPEETESAWNLWDARRFALWQEMDNAIKEANKEHESRIAPYRDPYMRALTESAAELNRKIQPLLKAYEEWLKEEPMYEDLPVTADMRKLGEDE